MCAWLCLPPDWGLLEGLGRDEATLGPHPLAGPEEEVAENWGAGAWGSEGWYQVQPPEDRGIEGAPGTSFLLGYPALALLLRTPGTRHPSLCLLPASWPQRGWAAVQSRSWGCVKCDGVCAGNRYKGGCHTARLLLEKWSPGPPHLQLCEPHQASGSIGSQPQLLCSGIISQLSGWRAEALDVMPRELSRCLVETSLCSRHHHVHLTAAGWEAGPVLFFPWDSFPF